MKTTKALQNLLMRIARDFELDLGGMPISYRLEDKLGNAITIHIENGDFLRIGEYKDFGGGKLTGDPEFLFLTGGREWLPVGFSEHGSDFVSVTMLPPDNPLRSFIPQRQLVIAEKCEAWACELMKRNDYDGKSGFLIPAWLT